MWFMNRVVNPLTRSVLRSPLSGLVEGSTLLVIYAGRRSGRRYTTPVNYARDGHTVIVFPAGADSKRWWRNLIGGAPVEVLLRRHSLEGEGLAVTDDEGVAEGLRIYLDRFPRAARYAGLPPDAAGIDADAVRKASHRNVIARITLEQE